MTHKICLIGSGNLGTNLGLTLHHHGYNIVQVISKNLDNAETLACKINAKFTNNISLRDTSCDTIIFAVSDDSISDLLEGRYFDNTLLIHTAGSVNIDIFKGSSKNYGVLYPLQSFSKNKIADFMNAPVFIEGDNRFSFERIRQIAKTISSNVITADSEQRLKLHVAAVFASNFTNHMYSIANELIRDIPIDFVVFKPLIREISDKAIQTLDPDKCQTGPAVRNDRKTIEKHLSVLKDDVSLSELYKFMSNRIFETKTKKENE
jgi:predicted short-subunit dehydrogenase-like oxidoreductase (DUF2520 family)